MLIFIMSIFYFLITTILTSIFFFKRKRKVTNEKIIKYILYYFIYILFFVAFLTLSYFINTVDEKLINRLCNDTTNRCVYYYTNNNIKIISAIIINCISNIIFYILTKKTILKLYNSKFKYIIFITYIFINYTGMLFSLLTFYGVVGIFVIKNPIIFFLRILCVWLPILIFPIDTFIIHKIKRKKLINQ